MSDLPWSKFFWADWEADQALRLCSLSAQGLWMRMLCVCARSEPYGYLAVNGRPLDVSDIARLAGVLPTEAEILVAELDRNGVFSRDRKGRIYSRRLVRDKKRSEEGRKHIKKRWAQPTDNAPQNPDPNRGPNRQPTTQRPEARGQRPEREPPPPVPVTARDPVVVVAASPPASDEPTDRERVLVAMGHDPSGLTATGRLVGGTGDMAELARWRSDLGLTAPEVLAVVAEVMATKRDGPPGSFAYFREAMRRAAGRKQADPLAPITPAADPAIERLRRVTAEYGT